LQHQVLFYFGLIVLSSLESHNSSELHEEGRTRQRKTPNVSQHAPNTLIKALDEISVLPLGVTHSEIHLIRPIMPQTCPGSLSELTNSNTRWAKGENEMLGTISLA
jgi:hypothetical protein